MYYFIPSWYDSKRPWYDTTVPWYSVDSIIQFDDTVNQVRMFHQAKELTKVLILNYAPSLRYFLHHQALLGVEYWSLFDEIQGFKDAKVMPVDFLDFAWPESCAFHYNPFHIDVMRYHEKYAKIIFAEDGNLLRIEFLKDEKSSHDFIFDDRGYLSSILYYDDFGAPDYQSYLNPEGQWVIQESLKDERPKVKINPDFQEKFDKVSYDSLEELIQEYLQKYCLEYITSKDVLIIATCEQNTQLMPSLYSNSQRVYSIFGDRYNLSNKAKVQRELKDASLLVTTHKEQKAQLENLMIDKTVPVLAVTPFDTRLQLGQSQQKKEINIYWFIDPLITIDEVEEVISRLAEIMKDNELIYLYMGMYTQAPKRLAQLQYKVDYYNKVIAKAMIKQKTAKSKKIEESVEEDSNQVAGNMKFRIFLNQIKHENALLQILQSARLLIDLSEKPDLFTQIAGISTGIPQINRVQSEYVTHKKNGYIIQEISHLPKAISYFIEGLNHWNQSLVYSVDQITDYLSGQLVKEWRNYLEGGFHE